VTPARARALLETRIDALRARSGFRDTLYSYDRNGLRMGIASLEDEVRELYDEWRAGKRDLPAAAPRITDEVLDVAAVAVLLLEQIP
jgi:hypothetical protein